MAAILTSIPPNSYYGMVRGQIHINLPPEHPILPFGTTEIKTAAASAKRSLIQSHYACIMCSNYLGIKLEPAILRFRPQN